MGGVVAANGDERDRLSSLIGQTLRIDTRFQERLKEHVADASRLPLLIFPEGTCVNNKYCVMFKRGAFDLGVDVVPVAIKYDNIFVDAFWNSRRQSFRDTCVNS